MERLRFEGYLANDIMSGAVEGLAGREPAAGARFASVKPSDATPYPEEVAKLSESSTVRSSMTKWRSTTHALAAACLLAAGCATRQGPSAPALPPEYAILPDTLVCVIDRALPEGLRNMPAKNRGGDVVLYVDGAIRPLESVHPVAFIAGYAGAEDWLRRGDPIGLGADRYARTGGERRIGIDLLRRAGEFQGILLFSGHEDAARPNALYVPTAPGCIFQAYVREELVGG